MSNSGAGSWWSNFIAQLRGANGQPQSPQVQQGQTPGVTQIDSRLYVYPEQPADRYDNLPGGQDTIIDLVNLQIQNGTSPLVLLSANPLLKNNVNSIMIFVSDADTVIRTDDGQVFNDHKLYHVINFLHSKRIIITPPTGKLPNTFDLAFVLSNEPICPYVIDLQLAHTKKFTSIPAVTDAFEDLFICHIGGYAQLTFILQETGGVNGMDWQVLVSEDGVNYFVLLGVSFPTIAAGLYQQFVTNIEWHFYKVQVKNHVGGAAAGALISASPIR